MSPEKESQESHKPSSISSEVRMHLQALYKVAQTVMHLQGCYECTASSHPHTEAEENCRRSCIIPWRLEFKQTIPWGKAPQHQVPGQGGTDEVSREGQGERAKNRCEETQKIGGNSL